MTEKQPPKILSEEPMSDEEIREFSRRMNKEIIEALEKEQK